ncbi:BBE domain-containing protein [Streptomyces sp. NPDC005017]|uniref:BBE domain-containing protein n=1 Tax=Streptomyces sp. NPDC005017 TaxID=3364706 RepID=UPI00369B27A4
MATHNGRRAGYCAWMLFRVRADYLGDYDRLVELERRYDPGNLFRPNHNIAP